MRPAIEILLLLISIPICVGVSAFITTWLQDRYGKQPIEDSLKNPYNIWALVNYIICATISVAIIWKILLLIQLLK